MLFQLQESTISKEKAAVQSELGQSKTKTQDLEKKGWLQCAGLTCIIELQPLSVIIFDCVICVKFGTAMSNTKTW